MATSGNPGKGKSPANTKGKSPKRPTTPTKWPETREEFVTEWFWKGSNGNDLIKELNCSESRRNHYIRREAERPTIYCIVLNDDSFPGKEGGVQWKLCKVGFTHVDTSTGTNNRMEQVKKDIERKYNLKWGNMGKAKPEVLFVLPIGAVDVTTFSDTEKRIRVAVGSPIHKDKAKEWGLPCSTEWVLTSQPFIDSIVKEKKNRKGKADVIDLFKDLKFPPDTIPPKMKTLINVDSTPKVESLSLQD